MTRKSISNNHHVIGIGIDSEKIARFKRLPFRNNEGFYKKIFSQKEIAYCLKKPNPSQHFAARFCAKEAFVKASRKKNISYPAIEVVVEKNKPKIRTSGFEVFLSLTHDRDQASACVVIVQVRQRADRAEQLARPNVNKVIEGKNIVLKPLGKAEITEEYLSWLNNSSTNKFLEVRHKKQTFYTIFNYVNSVRAKKNCEIFAIYTKAKNRHIGTISITEHDRFNKVATYGLLIGDSGARAAGLGGEATALMVEYFFRRLDVRKVWAKVIARNRKSWKTLESMGFTREGILREQTLFKDGSVDDQYVYGMLAKEWSVHRKKARPIFKSLRVTPLVLR